MVYLVWATLDIININAIKLVDENRVGHIYKRDIIKCDLPRKSRSSLHLSVFAMHEKNSE